MNGNTITSAEILDINSVELHEQEPSKEICEEESNDIEQQPLIASRSKRLKNGFLSLIGSSELNLNNSVRTEIIPPQREGCRWWLFLRLQSANGGGCRWWLLSRIRPPQLALHNAVYNYTEHESHLESLLRHPKIDINQKDRRGRTALHISVTENKIGPLELLTSSPGIRLNSTNSSGYTALHTAVLKSNVNAVNALLMSPQIDVNKVNEKSWAPIHTAAYKNDNNISTSLLGNDKIKINQQTNKGLTALHIAAQVNNEFMVERLLD